MKIKGSGKYIDATGKNNKILGVGEIADDEKLQTLNVSGNLSFKKISCCTIDVAGKCTGDSIVAQSLNVSGKLSFEEIFCDRITVAGKCTGDSLTAKNFSADGKIEIDSLKVEQSFELKGKPKINFVDADEIFIATRNGFLGEVKCRKIKISNEANIFAGEDFAKIFSERFNFDKSNSRICIKTIDAETVDLENCEVDVIKCKDAFIGKNCAIEKLFVAGECKVAVDSKVGETIYTK